MYSGNTLSLNQIEHDFVELNFNNSHAAVNKFDQETLAELAVAVEILSSAKGVSGLLITSAKPVFVVGADITEFKSMFAAGKEQFVKAVSNVQQTMSKIESLPFPSVVAINGYALGGGLEICLACDYRIISDSAVVGLPETSLGIIPGWGGTVRLPRLCGLSTALDWITSARQYPSDTALEMGVVDEIVPLQNLRSKCLEILQAMQNGKIDYRQRRVQKLSPIQQNQIDIDTVTQSYKEKIVGRFGDHYPAPLEAIDLMADAALLSQEAAAEKETSVFYRLAQTSQARALVGLFLGEQYVSKVARDYSEKLNREPYKIANAGVIGAGIMGGGIAYQNAISGYAVVMKDINQGAIDAGLEQADKLLKKSISKGKLDKQQAHYISSLINPTLDDHALSACQIIIEAVVERSDIKQSVLSAVEQQTTAETIIASNTSTISINKLASSLQRPHQFCGMHFFNPVNAMKLVEVIRGAETSDEAIATVCNYAIKLGKKPIVVNDCPGFLVNRVLFAMCFGLEMLLQEGVSFQQIDTVMEQWGMPMGPAYLMDVIGLDTISHCYSVMREGIPERFVSSSKDMPTETLFNLGRLGQKNGLGYYKYEKTQQGRAIKMPDPEIVALLQSTTVTSANSDIQPEQIVDRLLIPLAMEMSHCLQEGIVSSPIEADMALIWGIGFPAFRGGICRWVDEQGVESICQRAADYHSLGELYKPTKQLEDMAKTGSVFYP